MDTTPAEPGALLERLARVVGPGAILTDPADTEPYLVEQRGRYRGRTAAVIRPKSTAEVSEVVRLCAEAGQPIVPQAGNTSLVGGSIPFEEGREIVLSLARMDRIREVDATNATLTAEAGCILADVQAAAAEAGRLFPLSLGAEGSCRIGGVISTNAGGVNVLRYGNTRELVLGLEVVLADGRVWNGLRGLRKDNTGYDLKQVFIGAEGTLGIITAAVLKLFARPRDQVTALSAVPDVDAAMDLLERCRAAAGETITSFELMPRIGLEFAFRHVADTRDPFAAPYPWYVLAEFGSSAVGHGLRGSIEEALAGALEDGTVLDATIAQNEAQSAALWRLREAIVEGQKFEGGSIKHDVAVPLSRVPELVRRATAAVEAAVPGIRPVPFGHLGDGNIHINLSQPVGADRDAYLARWDEINALVHDIVSELGGSISAEHGIGRMRLAENLRRKPPVEIDLMRRLKAAFDPAGILNPGKVIK